MATTTKKTTTPKKVSAKKTVPAANLMNDMITEIENLTDKNAFTEAFQLLDGTAMSNFKLGGVLSVIQANSFFTEKGHETFKDCVEVEFGMKYRKAMYLVAIYNNLVAAEIEWEQVKNLGWTKLVDLSPVLTKENVTDLVAEADKMTVIQLKEHVANLNAGDPTDPTTEKKEPSELSTKTFKLHKDQREVVELAIEQGKKDSGSDNDSVALEGICLSYLNTSGKGKQKPQTIKQAIKKAGLVAVLKEIGVQWPDVEFDLKFETLPEELKEQAEKELFGEEEGEAQEEL